MTVEHFGIKFDHAHILKHVQIFIAHHSVSICEGIWSSALKGFSVCLDPILFFFEQTFHATVVSMMVFFDTQGIILSSDLFWCSHCAETLPFWFVESSCKI